MRAGNLRRKRARAHTRVTISSCQGLSVLEAWHHSRQSTEGECMAGKATSHDIAYLAGVSQPTVSRALRGSPMVSEETRRRIETIAQQLNYKVDKNASN